MKIPKKVKIGGYIFDVVVTKDVDDLFDRDTFGFWDARKGQILIKDNIPKCQQEGAFFHEIAEVALRTICRIPEKDFPHKDFSAFAEALFAVLKDNKLFSEGDKSGKKEN